MSDNPQTNIRTRATGAVIANAFLSWQSILTVVITILLTLFVPDPFTFWQPWFWLILGGIAEAAWVISTVTDPAQAEQAVARSFAQKFDLDRVRSALSRKRLDDALEYRRSMQLLLNRHSGAMRTSLQSTVADVDDWIGQMYDLALHVDAFEANELVDRDRRMVPQQLEKARIRVNQERDPVVRRDLEEQVRQLELQLQNLEATANATKRAEIQLDSTLSQLGTIYAQMSLLGAKDVDSARAQRLRLEIKEEVLSLQDTISAMDDVQQQRLSL